MMSLIHGVGHKQAHYIECHYVERCTQAHYDECHYTECPYTLSHGALRLTV